MTERIFLGRVAIYCAHGFGCRDGLSILDGRARLDNEIERISCKRQFESCGADVSFGLVHGVRRTRNRNFDTEKFDGRRRNQRTFVSHNRVGGRHTCGVVIFRRILFAYATSIRQPANESEHVDDGRLVVSDFVPDNRDGLRRDAFERDRIFGRLQLSRGNIAVVPFDIGDEPRR